MKLMQKFYCVFFVLLLICSFNAMAQSDYTVHAIAKGETLSALAKKYHTTVGDIMRLNNMTAKSILKIGQKIKVPAAQTTKPVADTKKTVTKTATAPVVEAAAPQEVAETATTLTPKYHVVGKKETLYGIGKKYKVTVAQIKQWNHLTKDNIHDGQKLIIGIDAAPTAVTKTKPVPAVSTATTAVQPQATATEAPAQQEVTEEKPVTVATKPLLPVVKKEASNTPEVNVKNIGSEGYFASLYQRGNQELSGDAATFKTASGWLDRKYYILINNVEAGTVVRISANNKIVFAKVLGPLPDIKEDNGLLMRLSNAAASALGVADSKFSAVINY